MAIKINALELENVKRIKAVSFEPHESGLTVIGGRNAQGKTSVLDAIAWALGGNKFKPSRPERDGSVLPPALKITLSNGLIVERKGKNSDLKITDPSGKKGGQKLLDEFIEELALNLPKFMNMNGKQKADELLRIIGVGEQLADLTMKENRIYSDRQAIGRIWKQKEASAKEMTHYDDVPDELISVNELIMQQQAILARNGENQRKRDRLREITFEKENIRSECKRLETQIEDLQKRLNERKTAWQKAVKDEEIAMKDAADLIDESTEELERNIQQVESINNKIRINQAEAKALDEAAEYGRQYDQHTKDLEKIRKEKYDLLNNADLPLEGLSVDSDGDITYKGQKWDNMSSAEQLMVATAIVRKLNPQCGFVLLDKLEQMDVQTMLDFGKWLEDEGLQAIATRVSTGGECSIIITDGYIAEHGDTSQSKPMKRTWKAGEF